MNAAEKEAVLVNAVADMQQQQQQQPQETEKTGAMQMIQETQSTTTTDRQGQQEKQPAEIQAPQQQPSIDTVSLLVWSLVGVGKAKTTEGTRAQNERISRNPIYWCGSWLW